MVIKAIARLVAVFVTIYVVWHEFPELATNAEFFWLLVTWGIYGVIIFWLDYRQAKESPASKKIDGLREEIKGVRDDLQGIRIDLINILGGKTDERNGR